MSAVSIVLVISSFTNSKSVIVIQKKIHKNTDSVDHAEAFLSVVNAVIRNRSLMILIVDVGDRFELSIVHAVKWVLNGLPKETKKKLFDSKYHNIHLEKL